MWKPTKEPDGVLLFSVWVLIALFAVVLFLSFKMDLAEADLTGYFLGAVAFSIVLITVNIAQAFRLKHDARELAEVLAKDMVAASQELFTELYRNSPVPYVLVNVSGAVISTNLATVRFFGVQKGQLDGANFFDCIAGDKPDHVSLYPDFLEKGLFINDEEVQVLRPDGGTRWVLFSLFSFKDAEQKRRGLITLIDITKQKEIDKVKSEFVSLASHQLLTPVSSIKWNLELLAGSGRAPAQEEEAIVATMQRNIEHMARLIDDFLNVSRLELGTLTPHIIKVNLFQMVTELLVEHAEAIEEGQFRLDQKLNPNTEYIRTDENLFRMVLSNLISNAVKYTRPGGAIRIEAFIDGDRRLTIRVADTGIGIPVNEQDKIFTKVYRATNASAQAKKGTGLGLYIAKEAVKVLGGTITFVSTENEGTTFAVTLPQ